MPSYWSCRSLSYRPSTSSGVPSSSAKAVPQSWQRATSRSQRSECRNTRTYFESHAEQEAIPREMLVLGAHPAGAARLRDDLVQQPVERTPKGVDGEVALGELTGGGGALGYL